VSGVVYVGMACARGSETGLRNLYHGLRAKVARMGKSQCHDRHTHYICRKDGPVETGFLGVDAAQFGEHDVPLGMGDVGGLVVADAISLAGVCGKNRTFLRSSLGDVI